MLAGDDEGEVVIMSVKQSKRLAQIRGRILLPVCGGNAQLCDILARDPPLLKVLELAEDSSLTAGATSAAGKRSASTAAIGAVAAVPKAAARPSVPKAAAAEEAGVLARLLVLVRVLAQALELAQELELVLALAPAQALELALELEQQQSKIVWRAPLGILCGEQQRPGTRTLA